MAVSYYFFLFVPEPLRVRPARVTTSAVSHHDDEDLFSLTGGVGEGPDVVVGGALGASTVKEERVRPDLGVASAVSHHCFGDIRARL